jgi:general secretion pathway protein E
MAVVAEKRRSQQFSVQWVLEVLVTANSITAEQAHDLQLKEAAARTHLQKASGVEKYDVSPIELIAGFQLPRVDRPGDTLDQDRISELVAKAAHVGYRKIDPLKLDMNLAAKTVSRPYAHKHCILALEGATAPGVHSVVTIGASGGWGREVSMTSYPESPTMLCQT